MRLILYISTDRFFPSLLTLTLLVGLCSYCVEWGVKLYSLTHLSRVASF